MNVRELEQKFDLLRNNKVSIDLSRGRPSSQQLDLSDNILNNLNSANVKLQDIDPRNYGSIEGLESCKSLFSDILDIPTKNLIIYGNSALNLEYELISDAFIKGICGCMPWHQISGIKWICLVPGYDRHFSICEYFGIEMISVNLSNEGPDMNQIEELVKDPLVKGIWCTPIYSNPLGITFSDEIVKRFASLRPAAKDFRIYWDLAYCLHHLGPIHDSLLNVFREAKKQNNNDLFYIFMSTSKVTYAGSGIAALACSQKNKQDILSKLKYKTICSDKVNQLRHTLFLKDRKTVIEHMKKHADIVRPKFNRLLHGLDKVSRYCKIIRTNGGYFISIFLKHGTAKNVISRCLQCGLRLTEAGCAYPYHYDPFDSHIRIAPTCLNENEIDIAAEILSVCIELEYRLSEE